MRSELLIDIFDMLLGSQISINRKLNKIMAQEQDLDAKLAELKTEMDAAALRDSAIADKLDEVQTELDDLKASQPDLTDEIETVSGLVEEAKSMAAGESEPEPTPEPAPEGTENAPGASPEGDQPNGVNIPTDQPAFDATGGHGQPQVAI